MAEIYCACIISNLEGKWLVRPLVQFETELSTSLEVLDRRTRRLEAHVHVAPPPPLLETSWDSLTWRVCRLSRMSAGLMLRQAPPLSSAATMPLMMSAISSIGPQSQLAWPGREGMEDKELLRLAAQWLWCFAGQRGFEIKNPSYEFENVCSLALDLSLEAEPTYPGRPRLGVHRPQTLPPGVRVIPAPPPRRSTCCHCCTRRNCNGSSRRDSSVSSDGSSIRRRKPSLYGWVKKLAFWRRNRIDDDSSSTSSTLADD
ncbi:uncharacterized protein F4822DRAFT_13649 [Hypoxylon trugodes]|uniref:uncharacterized protein n=1 Tax=Hypoxylon trugodes TaxID=326681 RepID=UPI00219DD14E|nr:uncharacterized protein F4822DRAFT_13649 [Hypoxylon trugodes]KAI1393454.1 hypothetical protein F4822DRAFT_13649 [Hypoxylon trugodes]